MTTLTALVFLGVLGLSLEQPVYLPYQLAGLPQYQSFPYPIYSHDEQQQQQLDSGEEEDEYEVSQFHSEDDNGKILFGFQSPDQVRVEARDADGTVRGSYSYIDGSGNIVKVQYWDDGSGFNVASNNLPIAIHHEPEYTPEVKAAREQHFRLYEQTLAGLRAAGLGLGDEENAFVSPTDDQQDQQDAEDTVIIENGLPPELPKQTIRQPFYRPVFQKEELNDDKESVEIQNPELITSRSSKSDKEIEIENKNRAFQYYFQHKIPKPVEKVENLEVKSVSTRAQEAGAIPVAAVHDSQVSPFQTYAIPNHQIYPVYYHEKSAQ